MYRYIRLEKSRAEQRQSACGIGVAEDERYEDFSFEGTGGGNSRKEPVCQHDFTLDFARPSIP